MLLGGLLKYIDGECPDKLYTLSVKLCVFNVLFASCFHRIQLLFSDTEKWPTLSVYFRRFSDL